jgi:hypothetical protein
MAETQSKERRKMKILVNSEVKELEIVDPKTGCNWEEDLIGNYDGFDGFDDEREMKTMTPETFDWWACYISAEQDLRDRAKALRDNLDNDDQEKFDQAMIVAGDNDIEQMQYSQIQILEEWEANLKKK